MQGGFGKTHFGGIIMHGMNNFGVITKMLTDWLYPLGGVQRRLETRWKAPVKPGDTIWPGAVIIATHKTGKSRVGHASEIEDGATSAEKRSRLVRRWWNFQAGA